MKKKYGVRVDKYWIEEVISIRIKSKGLFGLIYYYAEETSILFSSSDINLIDTIMKDILFVNNYKTELQEPSDEISLKRVLGFPDEMVLPFPIVTYDRIRVKFDTKQLFDMVKDEFHMFPISEIALEDYFDCRVGENVSSIHLILDENSPNFKEIATSALTTKNGKEIQLDKYGEVIILNEEDFKKLLEKEFEPFGEYHLFIQKGRIEYSWDELVICSMDAISEDTILNAWQKVFTEDEWKESHDGFSVYSDKSNESIDYFYNAIESSLSIPQEPYKTIITVTFKKGLKTFISKKIEKQNPHVFFAEGKVYCY